jgi:hypothetical protein
VAPLLLALVAAPQPPKKTYDKKRDVTVYSTGDVRTGGLTGMSAEFEFPGKEPKRPATVHVGFGALRVPDADKPLPDDQLLKWPTVNEMTLRFGDTTLRLPAKEGWQVSRNSMVQMFYGHAVEEHVDVDLTPEQFTAMAACTQITVVIGKDSKTIKGGPMNTLRKLAAAIP